MTSHESHRVVFGEGALDLLKTELLRLGVSRAFLVTTKGRAKETARLRALLGESIAGGFENAVEHVPVAVTEMALASLEETSADVIVALGGGSAIGLGKALARRTGLPLAAIPTTYSGSEMTSVYGETDENGKTTGRDPRVAPSLVLYDPLLTVDLPAEISAASGLNAVAHSVEALYAPNATDASDMYAAESIRFLAASLPRVINDPSEISARIDALKGAQLAGEALELTSMGLHHRICHVLGGRFGLPHAKTHAVMLRYVVGYNFAAADSAMRMIEDSMKVENAIDGISDLCGRLPVPRNLGELGFRETDVTAASGEIVAGNYPNPRVVSEDEAGRILRAALAGASPRELMH